MSGPRTIMLGGVGYAIGPFTIGQVSKIVPLLSSTKGYDTPAEASAVNTAIHTAVSGTSYQGTFEEFLKLPGVTIVELLVARREVGRAVGLYAEKDPEPEKRDQQPGEAPGEASP